jgi:hypothetical protein
MIRINLLPESYRRAERTSPKVFAAALAGVILVCSSVGWFGMVYFGDLARKTQEHKEVTERLAGVEERAKLFDDLTAEERDFSRRANTIKDIAKGRLLWTRIMDELITIVTNEGNYDRHVAWFSNMNVRGSRDGRKGPAVSLPGKVQGKDMDKVSNLIDDVEAGAFFRDVDGGIAPQGRRSSDMALYPPESYNFTWQIQFVPPDQWLKNQAVVGAPGK